jgi:hypothetical protein
MRCFEVQHSKANDLVQEELMSLDGVLWSRMTMILIVRCQRATCHREVHRQRGSWGTSTRDDKDLRLYNLNKFMGRIREYHARSSDWLNPRVDFPHFLRSHRNQHNRDKRRCNQIRSIVGEGLDR